MKLELDQNSSIITTVITTNTVTNFLIGQVHTLLIVPVVTNRNVVVGQCDGTQSLSITTTYSTNSYMTLRMNQSPYYFHLSENTKTLIITNLLNPKCSVMGIRLINNTYSSTLTTTLSINSTVSITASSMTTSTSSIQMTSTVRNLPPWPGTFAVRSLCSQWLCCCPIDTVTVIQTSTTTTLSITSIMAGSFCFGYTDVQTLSVFVFEEILIFNLIVLAFSI
ncbi:hypothetical protein I4U23_022257 [Adineta vaga]|nr:hypothetical protein I4U23_022257 [Adineta vaga]